MASICRDELDYFIDLAMNESQRWLETVTRERFLDEDDFLYSVRYGTQLRKLLNKLRPGSFSLPISSSDENDDGAGCSDRDDDEGSFGAEKRPKFTLEHSDQDEECWIPAFLRICRTILGIPPQRLFRPSDLDVTIEEREREGCFSTDLSDRIRRVVVTVAELAQLHETSTLDRSSSGPRIDKSALEPVIRYHDHLWLIGQENDHCLSAYSSPRIKRTASTRDSVAARRKATPKLSQVSTTSGGERDASLDNEDDELELPDPRLCNDLRSQTDASISVASPANMDSGQDRLNPVDDSSWSPRELQMLMRPLCSPNVADEMYEYRKVESESESARASSAQKVGSEGAWPSPSGFEDKVEAKRLDTPDVEYCCDPSDAHGEKEADYFMRTEENPSINSDSIDSQCHFVVKDHFERSSEYSFECSRSTSPDRASSSVFDTSSVSVITTASRPPSVPVLTAQKDNWNKPEKRTVRSTKNTARENQQAKIIRRPSAGIIAPAVTSNPLKYVQAKSDLDLRARQLIEKAKENKKKRSQLRIEEQEQEWAADLEDWKLRRSSSLASVRMNQSECDEIVRERHGQRRNNSDSYGESASTTAISSGEEHSYYATHSPNYRERRLVEPVSPTPATVSAESEMTASQQNTGDINGGGGEASVRSTTTSRLAIVASGGETGDTGPLSTTPVVPLQNGAHSSASSLTPVGQRQSKSTLSDKTTLSRSTGTNGGAGGVKNYSRSGMQENVDSTNGSNETTTTSEKFQALRNAYDANNTATNDAFRSRPVMKQADASRIAPVYAKIPAVEEATDSGVDSYRPESLTPSRDSHESLSPGSQGSADHSTTRKSSTEQIELGLRSMKNEIGSYRTETRTWDTYDTREDNTSKEFLVTLEQKREKGDKGFGFTLKGGHEKLETVVVDSVIPGSTADKFRMRVGDELLEIDGMDVSKAYLAMINATISQAAKAGSIELKLRRLGKRSDRERSVENSAKSTTQYEKKVEVEEPSFDQKRLHFEKAASFEQQTVPAKPPVRRREECRRSSPFASQSATSPPPVNRQDHETENVGQLVARYAGADENRLRSASHDRADFRSREAEKRSAKPVNSEYMEKTSSPFAERRRHPGKVTDFVPEVDRNPSSPTSARSPRRFISPASESDYRVTSVHARTTPGNILNFVPESERTKGTSQTIANKAVSGDSLAKQRNILEDREEIDQRWQRERARVLGLASDEKKTGVGGKKEYLFRPEPTRNYDLDQFGLPTSQGSRRSRSSFTDIHSGRSLSPPRAAPPPPPLGLDENGSGAARSAEETRQDSQPISITSNMSPPRPYLNDNTPLPEYTRPFAHVRHSPIAFSHVPVPTKRDGEDDSVVAKTLESSVRYSVPAKMDEQQRGPKLLDTESASRKLDDLLRKQQRQATEVELQYLEMAATAAASGVDITNHQPFWGAKSESIGRATAPGDIHQHWLVREAEDLRLTDQLRQHEWTNSDVPAVKPKQETRRHSSTVAPNAHQQGLNSQTSNSVSSPRPPSPKYPLGIPANRYSSSSSLSRGELLPPRQPQKQQEETLDEQQVVAVSAIQRCSHCDKELGRGAAMIIESLNLFFHLGCFKCYVCGMALSDGAQGADVRVRAHRLHCQRCYSNDDAGLQFSEV